MSALPIHYRIDDIATGDGVMLQVSIWTPIKETPQGYWVVDSNYERYQSYGWDEARLRLMKCKRFVLKASYKRWCYPTFEEALNSFRIRKTKYKTRLQLRLAIVQESLNLIEDNPALSLGDFKGDLFDGGHLYAGKPEIFNDFFLGVTNVSRNDDGQRVGALRRHDARPDALKHLGARTDQTLRGACRERHGADDQRIDARAHSPHPDLALQGQADCD